MEKKIPFFKKIIMSIKDLDKYNLLISEKLRRAILYLLELMIIFTLVVSAVMTYKTSGYIEETFSDLKESIPEFTINSEGLKIESEEPVIIEKGTDIKYKIIINDDITEIDSYQEQITDYDGIVFVAIKDKLVINANNTQTIYKYEDITNTLGIGEINKENVINLYESNRTQIFSGIFLAMFITTYLIYTISTAIDALALSLLVIIISKMARIPLKYSQCVIISISALTLPIIVNLVYTCANLLNGFFMPYFQIMYTLISYIYIVAVVLIMRSDLIKKKQLIKATIDIKKLEKEQENKEENKDEKDKEKDNGEEEEKDENGKDKPLDEVKKRVKNKLKEDKDNPEPQANIEGGKR